MESKCLLNKEHVVVTDTETGEVCCRLCGVVLIEKVCVSNHSYTTHTRDKSYHTDKVIGEYSLGSIIEKSGSASNKLNYTQKLIRLNKNKQSGLLEFNKAGDKLNMPNYIIEEALLLFLKHKKNGLLKALDLRTLTGAYYYLFAKKNNLNITLNMISKELILDQKQLFKYYKNLCIANETDSSMLTINLPSDNMQKLFSLVTLDLNTKRNCMDIVKKIEKLNLHVGRHPLGVAGVSIYMGCINSTGRVEKFSMDTIAELSNVSIMTIKNMFKDFRGKV